MSKKIIKWGILGTSYISEVMAGAMHESTMSQLVAIGSRSLDTANIFYVKNLLWLILMKLEMLLL